MKAPDIIWPFVFIFVFCVFPCTPWAADTGCDPSTLPADWEYCWCEPIDWDMDNPEEISPGNSVGLSVVGGCGPYHWALEGDPGFSLSANVTQSEAERIALTADQTACGTAAVTVTDNCHNVTGGHVKSTAGQWILDHSTQPHGCYPCYWSPSHEQSYFIPGHDSCNSLQYEGPCMVRTTIVRQCYHPESVDPSGPCRYPPDNVEICNTTDCNGHCELQECPEGTEAHDFVYTCTRWVWCCR